MSRLSDVPPSWLSIVEWTYEQQFDVTVNHGTAQVKFSCPSTTSKKDLMAIINFYKQRFIREEKTAMEVAAKLVERR